MKTATMVLFLVLAAAAWGLAAEQPSLKRGEELFSNTQLGTSGKSCASCHPGGKGLEEAATYKEDELADIINQCIAKPLKGKPLADDSNDLKSLIMYHRTFAPSSTTQ